MINAARKYNFKKNPIKATFVGCEDIKKYFQTSNCVVGISVGQMASEDNRLRALLNLINRNFACCTILVGDTLQRHNLYFSTNRYADSLNHGDDWILRNTDIISNLTIPFTVTRWDTWLNSDLFAACLSKVQMAFDNDEIFFNAVNSTIDEFYQRILKRNECTVEKKYFYECSKNYLLEEIAIIELMLPPAGYRFFIYPNKTPKAFEIAYPIFVEHLYPGMVQWVQVQLKKK